MPSIPSNPAPVLPPSVATSIWRGDCLVRTQLACTPTGWEALDCELPGKGWPSQCLTEVLQPQAGQLEWRLTAAALQQHSLQRKAIVAIGPPLPPHASGLAQQGLAPDQLVWINAPTPQDRLWALEQLIRANACGVLLAWLPQAHPDQIRRLQISAQQFEGLVFLVRPEASQHQASAAPLRLVVHASRPWSLQLQIVKRRGPAHTGTLDLPAAPRSLQAFLTPRMLGNATATPSLTPLSAPSSSPVRHDTALGSAAAPSAKHADRATAQQH